MPLNAEERMRQAEFEREREHYSRPTPEQVGIALLEQQLEHAQNSLGYYQDKTIELDEDLNMARKLNDQLEHIVDKQKCKLDQINGAIDLYINGDRKEGITLDSVINTMGWKR